DRPSLAEGAQNLVGMVSDGPRHALVMNFHQSSRGNVLIRHRNDINRRLARPQFKHCPEDAGMARQVKRLRFELCRQLEYGFVILEHAAQHSLFSLDVFWWYE